MKELLVSLIFHWDHIMEGNTVISCVLHQIHSEVSLEPYLKCNTAVSCVCAQSNC